MVKFLLPVLFMFTTFSSYADYFITGYSGGQVVLSVYVKKYSQFGDTISFINAAGKRVMFIGTVKIEEV